MKPRKATAPSLGELIAQHRGKDPDRHRHEPDLVGDQRRIFAILRRKPGQLQKSNIAVASNTTSQVRVVVFIGG